MSANGTKRTLRVALHSPLSGVKRTSHIALQMSAFDPKRTSCRHCKRTHSWQEIAAGIDATEEAVKQRKGV